MSVQAPWVNHLLFADDTLLFFKAEKEQAREVKKIINTYENARGQLINPAKCSILFGNSCVHAEHEKVRADLHLQ